VSGPFNHPWLILAVSLPLFWLSAQIGVALRRGRPALTGENASDFTLLLGATLTLLGLIIGFTFSMAVSRYDQRKNYEEQEANAIGTEYVRATMLPAADAAKTQSLLKEYLDQRILIYQGHREYLAGTTPLQNEMWAAVAKPAAAQPNPVSALVLSGMNDVLNSQGYTQAAWWNRIPVGAWALLILISMFCNVLIGFGAHGKNVYLFTILPIALSLSLFFIADIDSPLHGVIRVQPRNLSSLADSLRSQ
jgi:hypothetical protein